MSRHIHAFFPRAKAHCFRLMLGQQLQPVDEHYLNREREMIMIDKGEGVVEQREIIGFQGESEKGY